MQELKDYASSECPDDCSQCKYTGLCKTEAEFEVHQMKPERVDCVFVIIDKTDANAKKPWMAIHRNEWVARNDVLERQKHLPERIKHLIYIETVPCAS